jgi:hypothetical protein
LMHIDSMSQGIFVHWASSGHLWRGMKTFSDLQLSGLCSRANLNSGVLLQINVRDSARTFNVREDREMQIFNEMSIQWLQTQHSSGRFLLWNHLSVNSADLQEEGWFRKIDFTTARTSRRRSHDWIALTKGMDSTSRR